MSCCPICGGKIKPWNVVGLKCRNCGERWESIEEYEKAKEEHDLDMVVGIVVFILIFWCMLLILHITGIAKVNWYYFLRN